MKILISYKETEIKIDLVRLENGEVWKLNGKCGRCGECCNCNKCDKIKYETQNGNKIAVCTVYEVRPMYCAFYPRNPYQLLCGSCSFEWEKISG